MLGLVLTACWGLVTADENNFSPSISSIYTVSITEFSSSISTTSDPWSPVVGDTEGAPGITKQAIGQAEGLNGRRAAISLVENIRRQLMRDNYDYENDESKEYSSQVMDSPPSADIAMLMTSERKPSMLSAVPPVSGYRATHMLSPTYTVPTLSPIQMQVASVSMPIKSDKEKNFRSFDDFSQVRSFDNVPQSLTTKKATEKEHQIMVSKKDLLFYVDDSHLRRNNAHADIALSRRDKYRSNEEEKYEKQKLHSKFDNESKKRQTGNYKFVRNSQPRSQSANKTQSGSHHQSKFEYVKHINQSVNKHESQLDTLYDAKYVKQTETNLGNHHNSVQDQKHIKYDDKLNILQNRLYDNHRNEQRNVEKTSQVDDVNNPQYKSIKDQPMIVNFAENNKSSQSSSNIVQINEKRGTQQNNRSNSELQYDELQNLQFDNRDNFRRSNHKRRGKTLNKRISRLADSRDSDLHEDNNTQPDKKYKVGHKMKKTDKSNHKKKKHTDVNYKKKQKNNRKKNIEHVNKIDNNSKEHLIYLYKRNVNHRKVHKSKSKRTRHQYRQSANEKNKKHRKPIVDDKRNRQHSGEESQNQIIERSNNIKIKNLNEILENLDEENKDLDSEKIMDAVHSSVLHQNSGGNIKNSDLKGEHNYSEPDEDHKSKDVDSMDEDDFGELNKFNGRRMNEPQTIYQSKIQSNSHDLNCNNTHCDDLRDMTNHTSITSPSAKYKLLKVRAGRGSRRSNREERQFVQERGSKGVALFSVDGAPFPQFRLPRARRQYMDDHTDKRPPLMEQFSKRFLKKKHSSRRSARKDQH